MGHDLSLSDIPHLRAIKKYDISTKGSPPSGHAQTYKHLLPMGFWLIRTQRHSTGAASPPFMRFVAR